MLTVLGSPRRACDGLTRRETLKVGALSALGAFGLPQLLEGDEGRRRDRPGRAKSVILLYLLGGAATQDMIDLKPNAPPEVRGEFRPISTSVPGIHIGEHLPRMSRWMHKIALVRSLNHRGGCHNTLPSYTGFGDPLQDIVSTRDTYPPSMGSVCEWLRSREPGLSAAELPDYVYMPCYLGWGQAIRRPGPYGGFLGQRFDPLYTECAPYKPPGTNPSAGNPVTVLGEPRLPESNLAEGVTLDRLNTRRSLIGQIDDHLRRADTLPVDSFNRTQRRAFNLLTSNEIRAAFDIDKEDPRLRDRYGRTLFGNCSLTARRLVERGVRFINVTWDLFWDRVPINYDAWDTHNRNFQILKDVNLPEFDQTYTALLEDLEERGLLDETLVVVMSEMGRTPQINRNTGRDHWTFCYGMWFAGGGIRGGTVVGESDAQAAYVKDRPISPADVCATIYDCLGIDPDLMVPDRSGRPIAAAQGGRVIHEIVP
jgi:hypothetical protein